MARSRLEAIRDQLAPSETAAPTIAIEESIEASSIESEFKFPETRTIFPPFELEDHPIDDVRSLRVIVVGAGVTGISAGVLLPPKVPKIDLAIYERESDVGGVWHTNVYPGVRCDVPAHAYQATFEPSTSWSTAYAAGAEIKSYWKGVAEKYDVERYIKFNHKVQEARWSENKGKWVVQVEANGRVFTDEGDFLITATGHFSDPRLPNYPGQSEYKGHLRHSSNYDPNFDPTGKRIAVIGNGASGLQVLPQLQKKAARIDHYARNKTWVAAPIGGESLETFVSDRIERARESPEEYLKFRKDLESQLFSRFGGIFKDGTKNNEARESITKLMATRLGDRNDLLSEILPDFAPNCRRLTPGPGYLEALTANNVEYISTPIERFTKTGIVTKDGTHREVDAVICSTGHDISFSTAFPVISRGVNLQTAWRPGGNPGFPDSYLSTAAAGFPNFLIFLGPNATGPAGTLCHSVENQIAYAAQVLRKVSREGIRSIAPTEAAVRDFRAYCESFFPKTVMSQYCSSWYNGGIKGGRIHGLWPGSASHVNLIRRNPRWEDFEYTYLNRQGNRFGWFGNGWTTKDVLAAEGGTDNVDLTPWLQADALGKGVDLRGYHEEWWTA
ncbi:FAD/NAD(P)-binding domain-containing protein [Aaosphaeria arxii CBS 175.79]|uniref:FAD/NAD(P)-binding domain-containing protein n=1 Tax=Aaosphaeria arxii CBS 175.79 TaxID=1450172 RepID=A0A6A5XL76_9PLEO|nr:FAD/NAD(P)-binding domain-containing protein [Aaosphaeria arxii CBS 175.79]KAF2014038.1 FAD/NAD(P)-binding domain-containing protein [Aaosphaeria arxii CBS 175.79]